MARFLSMMWSEDVRDVEAGMAVHIVQELILDLYRRHWPMGLIFPPIGLRPFGTWMLQGVPEGSPYWGTQWYIEESYEPSVDKIVASRFLSLVEAEPWQQADRHYDLALVAKDLIASDDVLASDPDSFVLGATVPGLAAVVSVHRLRRILGVQEWRSALHRLMLHFFGHVIGLPMGPYPSAGSESESESAYHCANLCVMRDAPDVGELLRLAREEEDAGIAFCQECYERLKSIIIGHHFYPG